MEEHYITHLSKDPVFKGILINLKARQLKKTENLTLFLYSSIISQQLSTKVGDIIYKRFLALFDGKAPTSKQVTDIDDDLLRSIGLSRSKASYIKNVARFDIEHGLDYKTLNALPDDEVIKLLTSIKGIGKWSAQNFLIFALAREDVFSVDDLIIRNVVAALYQLDKNDKKKFITDMHAIAASWSPYRTYATLHLWEWNSLNKK